VVSGVAGKVRWYCTPSCRKLAANVGNSDDTNAAT
jgi:hypothetical protein